MQWDILQFFHKDMQTVAAWRFQCNMYDGVTQAFDGLSLISFRMDGKIQRLVEFGCNTDTYDPYEKGPLPQFRTTHAPWF